MNKKELSQKWSKYCNTDKLVDDTMALLSEYGHRNTEKGVCSLLDTFFTNKEPLIKMFTTSKNYIGDMRIVTEKEFERSLDGREIRNFFYGAYDKFYVNEMLKYKSDDGKEMLDYLPTGKKMYDTSELPTGDKQKECIKGISQFNYSTRATTKSINDRDDFWAHVDYFSKITSSTLTRDYRYSEERQSPLLKSGTKTSRAFNAVCTHYGVDKLHPEEKVVNGVQKTVYPYNKQFAAYSDLVSGLARKMQFVISLNPLDYLLMSNGVNWVSCHNIASGGCMGGTISYMLDEVSIITFVVENIDGKEIHKVPKVYRQMYHYKNNLFIQSRLYPQGNDGATNLYDKFREFVIEEFTDLLDVDDEWSYKVGPAKCVAHIQNADGAQHYPDFNYNRSVGIFYPTNNKPSISRQTLTVGHVGICVNCGKEYRDHGRLNHYNARNCV